MNPIILFGSVQSNLNRHQILGRDLCYRYTMDANCGRFLSRRLPSHQGIIRYMR